MGESYVNRLFDPACVPMQIIAHSKADSVRRCYGRALKQWRLGYRRAGCLSHAPLFCLSQVSQSRRRKLCRIHREFCKKRRQF